jgi:hypothetical protein
MNFSSFSLQTFQERCKQLLVLALDFKGESLSAAYHYLLPEGAAVF